MKFSSHRSSLILSPISVLAICIVGLLTSIPHLGAFPPRNDHRERIDDSREGSHPADNNEWNRPLLRLSLRDRLDSCESALTSDGILQNDMMNSKEHPEWLCAGLAGRLLKGHNESEFVSLADDPARRIVFVLGQDGLLNLVGMTPYEVLVAIGWSPADIQYAREHDYQFKLVVFNSAAQSVDIRSATWENLVALAASLYPSVSNKLWAQLPALRTTPMTEIEYSANCSFFSVLLAGPNDPRYMSVGRLERAIGSLAEVRLFLYIQFGAREQYTGTGFTSATGKVGQRILREFLVVDRPLVSLGEHRLIPLLYDDKEGK